MVLRACKVAAAAVEVRAVVAFAADPIDRGPLVEFPKGHVQNKVRVDPLQKLSLDQLNGARVSRRHTF